MDQLEILHKAKMYIDKLANGINPLTDQPVDDNDVVNNVKLSRCFFYVSDVLRQVIENGGYVHRRFHRRKKFQITDEELSRFEYSDEPITMKELVLRINKLIDQNEIRRISAMALNAWLRGMGLIEAGEGKYGKLRWVPSKLGEEIGIEVKGKMVYDKEYSCYRKIQSCNPG